MRNISLLVVSAVAAVLFAACEKVSYNVREVIISQSSAELYVDQTLTLKAQVGPDWADDHQILWSSSDSKVARVTKNGFVAAVSPGKAVITAISHADESKTAVCEITVNPFTMQFVDLGLSVKWAMYNVGATDIGEPGDYYAWGETLPYYQPGQGQFCFPDPEWRPGKEAGYSWSSYKWAGKGEYSVTKYISDDWKVDYEPSAVLELEDDAANVKYGGSVRIPTYAEWVELYANCDRESSVQNLHNGYWFKSRINGHRIFIPCAGMWERNNLYKDSNDFFYWTSNYSWGQTAISLPSYVMNFGMVNKRCHGMAIRPVCD